MIKRDELSLPDSCMNRAKDDEMTFVLLGRDAAAPVAIRAWVTERIRLGKNSLEDRQIQSALVDAWKMDGKEWEYDANPSPNPERTLEERAQEAAEEIVAFSTFSGYLYSKEEVDSVKAIILSRIGGAE